MRLGLTQRNPQERSRYKRVRPELLRAFFMVHVPARCATPPCASTHFAMALAMRRPPGYTPKAVSLFSGCGGSDAGVLAAGFDIVMANDILAYAKDVYEANHPDTDYFLGSVEKIKHFPAADLLVGCYPCQGFSQGGVRDPSRKIN
eukprot:gene29481-51489_t